MLPYLLGTDEPDRRSVARALAGLRIVAGLLWLFNANWKRPPDFGRESGKLLYGYVQAAIDHPVLAPFSWVMQNVVQPAFIPFGWGVLVVETLLAGLLLTGTFTRLAALLGIAQGSAIALSVLQAPGEWPWSYYLLLAVHVVLFFGSAGLAWGVDGVRAAAAAGGGAQPAARLVLTWGSLLAAVGLVAAAVAIASSPATLGSSSFEVSLGAYNVAGGVLLVVVGALMVAAGRTARASFAFAAAAVGLVCTATIWTQTATGSSIWLGANLTAAALFATGAVAAAGCGAVLRSATGHVARPASAVQAGTADG
ncbi:MAG: hypothetical protein ACOH2F_10465 [Cellulomonas sp.]